MGGGGVMGMGMGMRDSCRGSASRDMSLSPLVVFCIVFGYSLTGHQMPPTQSPMNNILYLASSLH